jgi:hypothetical protein
MENTEIWPETISPLLVKIIHKESGESCYQVYDGVHRLIAWALVQAKQEKHSSQVLIPAIVLQESTPDEVACSLASGKGFFIF